LQRILKKDLLQIGAFLTPRAGYGRSRNFDAKVRRESFEPVVVLVVTEPEARSESILSGPTALQATEEAAKP
jgi:hypothetical protein